MRALVSSRIGSGLLLCVLGAAASAGCGRVATPRIDALRVDALRVDPSNLGAALQQLAVKTHTAFGVELLDPVSTQAGSLARQATLDLSGLSVRQALDRLLAVTDRYSWKYATDGMIIIRPRERVNDPGSWLNTRIPAFAVRENPILESLHAVHRLFDDAYAPPAMSARAVEGLKRRDGLYAAVTKPLTLSMSDVSVWQILDAIARAQGTVSWFVRYHGDRPVEDDATIQAFSWEKWSLTTTSRPVRARTLVGRRPTSQPASGTVAASIR